MRITTKAHGLNPQLGDLRDGQPRIAFVNALCVKQGGEDRGDNIWLIGADDLSINAIPMWMRWCLLRSRTAWVKMLYLHRSRSDGYPSAPMSIDDGLGVLDFIERIKRDGAKELTISCEYGRSRSVTLAGFLSAHLDPHSPPMEQGPNEWVRLVMARSQAVHAANTKP